MRPLILVMAGMVAPTCGCTGKCEQGTADCDGDPINGCEVDLLHDIRNCGGCGHACCGASAACNQGFCSLDSAQCVQPNPLSSCAAAYGNRGRTLAADATSIYWNCDGREISRFASDGSKTVLVSMAPSQAPITSIALAGDVLYFARQGEPSGSIWSIPKGGGDPTVIASNVTPVGPIAIDADNVYWGEHPNPPASAQIFKAPLTGGIGQPIVGARMPIDELEIDDTNVYWIEFGFSGLVASAAKGGGSVTTLYAGVSATSQLRVFDAAVYFTDGLNLRRISIGGGAVEVLGGTACHAHRGLALESNVIYSGGPTSGTTGELCKLSATTGEEVLFDISGTVELALAPTYLYSVAQTTDRASTFLTLQKIPRP